jgi:hypothetical protein
VDSRVPPTGAEAQQQSEEDPDPLLLTDQTIREAIRDVMENLSDKDWRPRSRIAVQIL